jgi:hypothetical protein
MSDLDKHKSERKWRGEDDDNSTQKNASMVNLLDKKPADVNNLNQAAFEP